MSIAEKRRLYSPEDLLALPEGKTCELVDGELVEKNMGVLSCDVVMILIERLLIHLATDRVGKLFDGTMGYQCFSWSPKMVRKPDISLIRKERFTEDMHHQGFVTIPPDLAVEVTSPNDLSREVEEKVEEYLRAGVPLVWVVQPETRIVIVSRKDRSSIRLSMEDELTGEDVIPGFRCPVKDLFPQQRES